MQNRVMVARLNPPWKWYVYEIRRNDAVIYVGKGCGKRGIQSAKEKNGELVIVAYFQHQEHALSHEQSRIAERLNEGHKLKNITHGNSLSWWKRTDGRAYAQEVLEDLAYRIGTWVKIGRLDILAKQSRMSEKQLLEIYQEYGVV